MNRVIKLLDRQTASSLLTTINWVTCAFVLTVLFCVDALSQIPSRVIVNSGFEAPVKSCASWSLIPQAEMLGWKTTDTGTSRVDCGTGVAGAISNPIEIWSNGFSGITARSGSQLAEINANINGFLYQDVCLVENETVTYSVWHRRRENSGTDTFRASLESVTGTVISQTANLSSSNNLWNNFTGTLTNNGTTGLRRYGFRAISTASGSPSVGNLIDDVTISLRPLTDIRRFDVNTIAEASGVSNLEIYVNGTLRSSVTLTLTKNGTATYNTDFTVGTASRGTATVAANGDITFILPAGDYDPNQSTGIAAGLISIPITAVNDAVLDDNETVTYVFGTASGGGGGNPTLDLTDQINGQSASCSGPVGNATVTIRETRADLSIAKSQRLGTSSAFQTSNLSVTQNQTVQYQILATNNGTSTVTNAVITDNVPSNLTALSLVSATANNGATACSASFTGNSLTGNFSSPSSGTCTIIVQGTATTTGNITNSATITPPAIITDPTSSNNSSSVDASIIAPPAISLVKSCPFPADCTTASQLPGTDLTYKIEFTNTGGLGAANLRIVDGIPLNTDYKVGSAAANVGTTGLTFEIDFSSDYDPLNPNLATWTYLPVSGAGGAVAGYDRNVKAIRWRVTSGILSSVSPNNIGDISFETRIR